MVPAISSSNKSLCLGRQSKSFKQQSIPGTAWKDESISLHILIQSMTTKSHYCYCGKSAVYSSLSALLTVWTFLLFLTRTKRSYQLAASQVSSFTSARIQHPFWHLTGFSNAVFSSLTDIRMGSAIKSIVHQLLCFWLWKSSDSIKIHSGSTEAEQAGMKRKTQI